jgi:ribosomal protein L32
VTERSSGTRYSRKNSGGTPPSKPYPLSQQLPDRGSKASKCRPTKLIPLPTSATRRQRKRSFQMSSDKANSPSHVSDPQTEEAKLPNVVRPTLQKKFTLSIPKERRTSNDNNKIQRQTHTNPYINPNHHLPHHPQLQPNPCSSRTQRGHNPERVLPYHNPVTR